MYEFEIDWPAWYKYRLHINRLLDKFLAVGYDQESIMASDKLILLGWGNDYVSPFEMQSPLQNVFSLFHALRETPYDIRLTYIHKIREKQQFLAGKSQIPFDSAEVQALLAHKLAERPPIKDMLNRKTIADLKALLNKFGIEPPKGPKSQLVDAVCELAKEQLAVTNEVYSQPITHLHMRAPSGLDWDTFHVMRSQVRNIGHFMYDYLRGYTRHVKAAELILSN